MEKPDRLNASTSRAERMREIRARREREYGPGRNKAKLPKSVVAEALELQAKFAEGARRAS